MNIKEMTFTPEKAQEWLDTYNTRNRNVSKSHVQRLASDMEHGRWVPNGDAITLDNNNVLVNGQHRLMAVVESGATITFVVIKGVSPAAFHTTDMGRGRSVADRLHIEGVKRSSRIAAAALVVLGYDEVIGKNPQPNWNATLRKFTRIEIGDFASHHSEELEDADHDANFMVASSRLKAAHTAALYLIRRAIILNGEADGHWDSYTTFLASVSSGANLPERSPILALRNRLFNVQRYRHNREEARQSTLAVLRAWNYWLTDTPTDVIRVLPSSPMPTIELPQ